jgi:cytochrome c peroxidase
VWNAAFLSVQFWDGRAPSLEEQAKGPITNAVEMGMKSHPEVVARLKTIPGYVKSFGEVFGGTDPLTIDNIAKAIAAYERTLLTPNAPYDRYQAGDQSALSDQARAGLQEFQNAGCLTCHNGPILAGPALPQGQGFYMKFPLIAGSPYEAKYKLTEDKGRAEATKNAADANMWRVPTLRNVALTAPYFHNGSVSTLPEAVRVMAKSQVNRDLTDDQAAKITAFLESLNGERPKQQAPKLP